MSKLLSDLNEEQQKAVQTATGPLLIIAGAGSGKTRALTYRIAYQIEQGISPWNILAVTFTNKAAAEMKNRLINLLQDNTGFALPTMGTFHSICVRILRKKGHHLGIEDNFIIYDEADQRSLMKQLMKSRQIDESKVNPRAVLNHISAAKSELINPDDYRKMAQSYFTQKVAELYPAYEEQLRKNTALDFDDLIKKTIELFQGFPDILDFFQEKFKFISVDEYQDTNHAQYTLINLLAQKYRNLCVIGDSDQSIYSWRGADIRNILNFEKDYPEAKIIKLEQNYRSTQNILEAAHQIIVKNKKRKEKKLWTLNQHGEKIKIWTAEDERHEGEMIIQEIKKNIANQESPNYTDFVILYRTNAQSRVLEEVFMRNGLPYKIVGGVKFYQRKEIKDLLAYLKLVQNPHDNVSLLRIINVPPRKVGPKTLELLQNYAQQNRISLNQALEQVDKIEGMMGEKKEHLNKLFRLWQELVSSNKRFTAAGVIKTVLHQTGYKDFLLDNGSPEGEVRLENVQELISVASKYDKLEPGLSLATFLEEVALISDLDEVDEKDNAVTMMTLHSAKGLEFDSVFIVGLEEGVFPHSRALFSQDEFEEERRLMYVGTTRAKQKLYLLHAKERLLYGEQRSNAPSQFLDDIPEDLVEFNNKSYPTLSVADIGLRPIPAEAKDGKDRSLTTFKDGDRVNHPVFGSGVVISLVGGIITVAFKDAKYGIKKLALNIAPLVKL